ncbi:MerR family transcriptional regulator [Chloroflexota bacterium]
MKGIKNYPLYSIGVVSELLGVHPETIRTWEKFGVVQPPQRRSGKRFYSERDFKRLQFIQRLVEEGLTLRAVRYYLRSYPCWKTVDCASCLHASDKIDSTKQCWQEAETYCHVADNRDPCANCESGPGEGRPQRAEPEPDTVPIPQGYKQSQQESELEESQEYQTVL